MFIYWLLVKNKQEDENSSPVYFFLCLSLYFSKKAFSSGLKYLTPFKINQIAIEKPIIKYKITSNIAI